MTSLFHWVQSVQEPASFKRRFAGVGMLLCCLQTLNAPLLLAETPQLSAPMTYRLGPEDSLLIHVKDEPEIPEGPYQIDLNGDLRVPELGTMHVAGTSLGALVGTLTERCRRLLKTPVVHVSISEYRSQRVSVLGAVGIPGVQQIRGRKTLYEAISDAGGLKPDAGGSIQLSRRAGEGLLPISGATKDATGRYQIGHIDVHELMQARSPATNIVLEPNDVITVPRAELVYVLGAVRKPGGFELVERQQMSVMQALSLAGGPERTAGTRHARILHPGSANDPKTETPVDLDRMIAGKLPDVMLRSSDILIIPDSARKAASFRVLEALLSTGTGVAIYRPY